jgi:hypothetical protein
MKILGVLLLDDLVFLSASEPEAQRKKKTED